MTDPNTIRLSVSGMSCASCVGRVEKALGEVPGLSNVSVNLVSETAQFQTDDAATTGAAVAALSQAGYPASTARVTLNVDAMSCASCVGRVEQALVRTPGLLNAAVNLATETAVVEYLSDAITPEEIARISTEAGYPAEIAQSDAHEDRSDRKAEEADALARRERCGREPRHRNRARAVRRHAQHGNLVYAGQPTLI